MIAHDLDLAGGARCICCTCWIDQQCRWVGMVDAGNTDRRLFNRPCSVQQHDTCSFIVEFLNMLPISCRDCILCVMPAEERERSTSEGHQRGKHNNTTRKEQPQRPSASPDFHP